MRRKLLSVVLGISMLAAMLSGCGLLPKRGDTTEEDATGKSENSGVFTELPTTEDSQIKTYQTEAEVMEIYSPLMDKFCNMIITGDMSGDDASNWLFDVMLSSDADHGLSNVGYLLRDISGDGVPELLIGSIAAYDENIDGSYIFACYTINNGEPVSVLDGWYRSSYRLMNTGQIYFEGSGGLMYNMYGIYDISEDGTQITCQDYYFTTELDGNPEEMGLYHNTIGEADPEKSETLELSQTEFFEIAEDYRKDTVKLPYNSLMDYAVERGFIEPSESASEADLQVEWLTEMPEEGTYDKYDADTNGEISYVKITTNTGVWNFKVLALTYQDVTQDGDMIFDEEEVYSFPEITPGRPFVLGLTFLGDIPNNGISYVDNNGVYHRFAIQESGMDGSLLLMEY